MDSLTPSTPMHLFDTARHEIACGVRGAQHRSTKHARSVTCPACLALARERGDAADCSAVQ